MWNNVFRVQWLRMPAQQPETLDNNESIHANPCGEFVLQRLQQGAKPAEVAQEVLREYLVQVSTQRLLAYRRYREESFEYLTTQKLETWHWEALYGMATLDMCRVHVHRHAPSKQYAQQCRSQRSNLCEIAGIAEERVPLESLVEFWQRHERHARLPLEYPEATVLRHQLPWILVNAYRATFDREALPNTATACV